MKMTLNQTFETWVELRLTVDEDEFDGEMLDYCELAVLGRPVTDDLAAVQVATVLRAVLEDGEVNGRHAGEAMERLIAHVASRGQAAATLPLVQRLLSSFAAEAATAA
jgi:hypothetical protein